jgi:hypothetical protein
MKLSDYVSNINNRLKAIGHLTKELFKVKLKRAVFISQTKPIKDLFKVIENTHFIITSDFAFED